MTRFCMHVLTAGLMLVGLAGLGGCNGARNTAVDMLDKNGDKGFVTRTLQIGSRERKYVVFTPLNYNPSQKYPVIVFLHGVGEGGSDARKNLTVGLAPFVADNASDFEFICVFPQSSNGRWNEESESESDAMAILKDVKDHYSVDEDRISLTGLSTGGYGTYAIGARHRDVFAALVPMGSSSSASQFAEQLVGMPIQAFCNGSDMFAGFTSNDRGAIERIKALGGTNVEFTETPDGGHDCWDGVYSRGELFTWLKAQTRRNRVSSAMPMMR